jgi:hypothetical protein
MNISRKKFVFLFIIGAFAFQFLYNSLLGPDTLFFPKQGESYLETDSDIAWKSAGAKILLPIKLALLGPMLSSDNFLREDPPPPFVAAAFIFYWSILALIIHYLIRRVKYSHE